MLNFTTINHIKRKLKRIPRDLKFNTEVGSTWDYVPLDSEYIKMINFYSTIYDKFPIMCYKNKRILMEVIQVNKVQLVVPIVRYKGKRPIWKPNMELIKEKSVSMIIENRKIIIPAYGYHVSGLWKSMYNLSDLIQTQ